MRRFNHEIRVTNGECPSSAGFRNSSPWLLDWLERALVLAWFSYFVWRLLPVAGQPLPPGNWLLLASEGLVIVLFVIRRRASALSTRGRDWLLAIAATLLPLSAHPAPHLGPVLSPLPWAAVMVVGLLVQVHAKLTLGRSMGMVAANRGLKRSGPYQFVRHPMYAGYVLTHVGFLLLNPSGWNLAVYAGALATQVFRLLAEEQFLAQAAEYRQYMSHVRYRLIPGIF